MRIKIFIFVYIFSQIYLIFRNLFQFLLNKNHKNFCLFLYGQENDISYYSPFEADITYFNYINLIERFFRSIFCYLIPIFMVSLLITQELKYIKESSENVTPELSLENDNNIVQGLNFNY